MDLVETILGGAEDVLHHHHALLAVVQLGDVGLCKTTKAYNIEIVIGAKKSYQGKSLIKGFSGFMRQVFLVLFNKGCVNISFKHEA